ncbi:tricalbin [Metschnikowia bicuspidata var. bicuspidata NRRL YB-4993]|uniref:Tricalbin n=1 Tax=Metschnikowia bicuspidata var. bicuspidata NRRL YB-4993 TaxID=869754 RepID=A0A1A0HDZ0_9ASCO|nr:tricalbin [Metschnikowia bicuspidata var. bicuspidata NRRL YB-4993]OBA22123.1 tricalbin [Metschnikowia bicuspidata var. bicuspidata NRRL YB-4993]
MDGPGGYKNKASDTKNRNRDRRDTNSGGKDSGGKQENSGGKQENSGGKQENSGGKQENSGGKQENSGRKGTNTRALQDDEQLQKSRPTFSWKPIGAWDMDPTADKEHALRVTKDIENYVIDHFYGDWFWNTVLPVGVSFFAYALARGGLSVLWLPVVLMCAFSVYRAEFRRFNRDIRDDMQRVHAANRLDDDLETMEWMNAFMAKFWVIYMPALSEMVLFQANDVLKDQAPGFGIEAISLDEFTLGSKAPRVDSIRLYTRKGKDHIEMDWAFSFTPNDTDDMTKNEMRRKVSPKVALGVTVGKAFILKSLPILVEDMSFTGRMNIKLKLIDSFPHVKLVAVQFLEPPVIDYALKPVGGDTFGIDIMSLIPGLASFVNGLIHLNLRPMLYAPNSLDIDVEELMAQQSNDSVGVLAVRVKRIVDLRRATGLADDVFHPYVQLTLSNNSKVCERTAVKKNTACPVYLETKYVLVNALDGNHLLFNVFHLLADKCEDQPLGIVDVPLAGLLQDEVQEGVSKNIVESGKVVGRLEFDLRWHAALPPQVLDDGTREENIDLETGIMKLSVFGATHLDLSQSVIGILNPYAEVYVNHELIKTSRGLKKTNEPDFGVTFEALVTQQSQTLVQVIVKDLAEDNVVGRLDTNLQDLVFESSRGQQWITAPPVVPGGVPAHFRIGAKWKAISLLNELTRLHTGAPIGGLRLHVRLCSGLINLESVGDVDPYVRVVQSGKLKAKTPVVANTSDPYFNQVFFLPVANEHQHILLDIMDAEAEGKDRPLGSCAVSVKNFLKKNDQGYYLGYDGANEVIEQPVLYNGRGHGSMAYSVSFVPTLPVYTRAQLENLAELERLKAEQQREEEARALRDKKLITDHPDDYEWVDMQEDQLPEPPKIQMPVEKAIKYRAGTITVRILSGTFAKPDYYVHTLFDDHAFPSHVTPRIETRQLTVATDAEAFIRDLPNLNLIFRVSKKREVEEAKDVVAEKSFATISVLERAYHKPMTLRIDEKNSLSVQVEFAPSAVKLPPLDTVLDVGLLTLDILAGENLPSADSNGKSDPFVVVKLDGVEIHRTDKRRRTLDPLWNDAIEFPMLSRSRQRLMFEVYDWDLTHEDKLLGRANADLSTVTPNSSTPFKLALDTQGVLSLRATFRPEYVRPALSSRGGLPIDLHDIASAPLKIVGGGAGIATNVVGSGAGMISDGVAKGGHFFKGFGRLRKRNDSEQSGALDQPKQSMDQSSFQTETTRNTSATAADSQDDDTEIEDGSENDAENEKQGKKDNRQAAPPPGEQMKHNRPPSLDGAVPNMVPEFLPPPQKPNEFQGHRRGVSTSTDISSIHLGSFGPNGIPGRINILTATGFKSSSLEIKTSVVTSFKTKDVHKTRATKAVDDVFGWNETFAFKAPADAILCFTVREHHHFGKNRVLGSAELRLLERVDSDSVLALQVSGGELKVHLRYMKIQS